MTCYRQAKGFSLIELLIVMSIIAILASFAVPSYQTYLKRARFTEIITLADAYKTAITLAIQEGNALKDLKSGSYGIPASPKPTKNLLSFKIDKGIIKTKSTMAAGDATYELTPDDDGNWAVSGTCIEKGLCHG